MAKRARVENKLKKCRFSDQFQLLAVLISVLGVASLATVVSGATFQSRRTGVVGTDILDSSTQKTPGRRVMHPAFANAGRAKGVQIWRIENFEPVSYPQKDYGKFYNGDSYIILNTNENKNKDLSWDVHFWLGSQTSTDEAGAAAILTVQLDDLLNGGPVQHREVQDHESQLFLGYFKNGNSSKPGDVNPVVTTTPPLQIEQKGEYRNRKPHDSYRMPRYSTPSNIFGSKQRLLKIDSEVSKEKIVPSKSNNRVALPASEKGSTTRSSLVRERTTQNSLTRSSAIKESRRSSDGRSKHSSEGTLRPKEDVRASVSIVTFEELEDGAPHTAEKELSVNRLDNYSQSTSRKPENQSNETRKSADDSSPIDLNRKPAGAVAEIVLKPRVQLSRVRSSTFDPSESDRSRSPPLAQFVPQSPYEISHVTSNMKSGRKPPMDDAMKIDKKLKPAIKTFKLLSKKDRKYSIVSLQLPKRDGIRYENGGVASGFRHAETNAQGEKRLFQVKGKRNVRVRQVNLSVSSMNKGDCFILDAGNNIYVYVGSSSKRVEKLKAISAANQIRDQDHNGRSRVHIIDDFGTPMDKEQFFTILGSGSPSEVPEESVAEEDGAFETSDERSVTLYKVSDASGSLKIDTIGQKPLQQSMLDSSDCFILDTGSGIYVWVGKGATQQEKNQAMAKAQGFLQSKKYPAWTNIQRIVEGAESAPFKQYFSTWRDVGMQHTRLIRAANDDDSDTAEDAEFDPAVLHALKKSGGRAIGFMPDNGEGTLEAVYRIEKFNLAEISPEMYGMLYGGDSYVVKYHYKNKRGGQGYVIYYWQGKDSSLDEKASSALHALRLDNEMNGTAIQVRVTQGHEPRHFLKVFQGKLITFIGGHASGFKNVNDEETYNGDGSRLFRVRGTCKEDVRTDQRPAVASSLASDDVFLLETSDKIYVWKGVGASDYEKEVASQVVPRIAGSKALVNLNEGSENSEFWAALGGKGDYDKVLDPDYPPFLEPRLFHCRILANGKFRVEEVHHFEQEDLDVDDIMVLDGGDEVYVWIGDGSTLEEREKSVDMANQYIRTDPSERSEETVPLVKVQQGNEPRSFKRLFPAWDDDVWKSLPTYEDMKKTVSDANSQLENEIE